MRLLQVGLAASTASATLLKTKNVVHHFDKKALYDQAMSQVSSEQELLEFERNI